MKGLLVRLFAIDPRSLAALRITLGVILLVDLANRSTDLVAHYTDAGAMPRTVVRKSFLHLWGWSLHALGGSTAFEAAMFLLAVAMAVCLVIGYRARLATFLSWLLLVSLHSRSPALLNGGDTLLRMLLFWSMFLPLGRVWSLDGRRRERAGPPADDPTRRVLNMATVAILLQVCLVYWVSAFYKWNDDWCSGTALYYALSYANYARPLAGFLLGFPQALSLLSRATLAWEFAGPALALIPFKTREVRLFVVLGFVLLHLGIELTMTVGLFSYVAVTAWLVFVPGRFWDAMRLTSHEKRRQDQLAQSALGTAAEEPGSPTPQSRLVRAGSHLVNAVVAVLLVAVVAWNVYMIPQIHRSHPAPLVLQRFIHVTRTWQNWGMFARPPGRHGWYVVLVRLDDGQLIDLARDGQPADWQSWQQPADVAGRYPNHRWRKFYANLSSRRFARYRGPLCDYLLRQWKAANPHAPDVAAIELHYMEAETLPPDAVEGLAEENLQTPDEDLASADSKGAAETCDADSTPPVQQRLLYKHEFKPVPVPELLRLPDDLPDPADE